MRKEAAFTRRGAAIANESKAEDALLLSHYRLLLLTGLSDRLSSRHRGADGKVQTAARDLADRDTMICGIMNSVRDTGRLASEQKDIVGPVRELEIGNLSLRAEQNKPPALGHAPCFKGSKIDMTGQGRKLEIVHARPLQIAVGDVEASRLDNVDAKAEARRHAQNGSRIASNVRLIERNAQIGVRHDPVLSHRRGLPATPCRDEAAIQLCGWLETVKPATRIVIATRTNGGMHGSQSHHDHSLPLRDQIPMGSYRLTAESGSTLHRIP